MRALLALGALLAAGCATVGDTPGQRLYAAYGAYSVALGAAADYRETPSADPGIVRALQRSVTEAAPVVAFGRAYVLCGGRNDTALAEVDCTIWDFRSQSVSAYAMSLRTFATSLMRR